MKVPMRHLLKVTLLSCSLVLSTSLILSPTMTWAAGPQKLSPEVHEALRAMAAGTATPRQKAILFANNDAINKARLARQIPDGQYQAAQESFKKMNQDFAADAAKNAGAEFEVQKSKSTRSQPGTDSDYITKVESPQQIRDMQTNYNRNVNDYLKEHGVIAADRSNWHNKLDTDFMADPAGVTKAEFEEIARLNNDAYKRRQAASWEYKSRNPEAGPITQDETTKYIQEMQDFRNKKEGLIDDMQGSGTVERGSLDEGKLTQKQAQQQKYDSRIGDADARYRADHGLSPADNPTHDLARTGAIREPDVTPEKARELLGMRPGERLTDADMRAAQSKFDAQRQSAFATEQNIHQNANRSAADGIIEKASIDSEVDTWMRQQGLIDPDGPPSGHTRAAARDAAQIMENMPPSEKGRFMAEVEAKLPKDPVTGELTPESRKIMNDLVEEMRKHPGKKPGQKQPADPDADGGTKKPAGDAETSKVSDADGPKTGDADGPKVSDGDGPKVSDGDTPKVSDGDGPKVSDGDAPKVTDGDGPKVSDGDAPKVSDGDAPKVSDGDAPKVSDGDTPKVSDGDGPKVSDGDAPKVSDGDAPKTTDVDTTKVSDVDGAPAKVTDVDGPKVGDVDGPKTRVGDVDGPKTRVGDVDGPKTRVGDVDGPKAGGVLETAGQVMTGVDILNTGPNCVSASRIHCARWASSAFTVVSASWTCSSMSCRGTSSASCVTTTSSIACRSASVKPSASRSRKSSTNFPPPGPSGSRSPSSRHRAMSSGESALTKIASASSSTGGSAGC